ncbi:MAG: hypothetical protein JRN18_01615 [Nitrososphaerota archaeon]|jgi:hypothetical protein|nr:hypothetical protein [Nitrososphaerota archaeon]MDG6917375.1 hypothetical protein [Nitrososphaerota archaeon]MDG6917923.1 hypothetical protein [Nitrososphaerota archaeon]MDG6947999.1 hypothetical protein [Nitrososphaerota archaeon]
MLVLHLPTGGVGLLVYIIGLAVLWAVVSVPVYFAGKLVKGDRATFGSAMGATLGGVVVYYVVYLVVAFALGAVMGSPALAVALVLGLLGWLAVFRQAFNTSWLGAVAVVVLAWLILMVLDVVLIGVFGVGFPAFYPF